MAPEARVSSVPPVLMSGPPELQGVKSGQCEGIPQLVGSTSRASLDFFAPLGSLNCEVSSEGVVRSTILIERDPSPCLSPSFHVLLPLKILLRCAPEGSHVLALLAAVWFVVRRASPAALSTSGPSVNLEGPEVPSAAEDPPLWSLQPCAAVRRKRADTHSTSVLTSRAQSVPLVGRRLVCMARVKAMLPPALPIDQCKAREALLPPC